jgi:hypothetical protein
MEHKPPQANGFSVRLSGSGYDFPHEKGARLIKAWDKNRELPHDSAELY